MRLPANQSLDLVQFLELLPNLAGADLHPDHGRGDLIPPRVGTAFPLRSQCRRPPEKARKGLYSPEIAKLCL